MDYAIGDSVAFTYGLNVDEVRGGTIEQVRHNAVGTPMVILLRDTARNHHYRCFRVSRMHNVYVGDAAIDEMDV
jgi:hypothetical protein